MNARPPEETGAAPEPTYPAFVDWLVAGLAALAGLFSLVAGAAVLVWMDRDLIARGVEEGEVRGDLFSPAETVDVASSTVRWTGGGFLVVGLVLLVGAAAFALYRRRSRGRTAGGRPGGEYAGHAVLGAATATILSFVPFSTVLGGGVAGYLERERSTRTVSVGAIAGLLPAAVASLFLTFVFAGLVLGTADAGRSGVAAFFAFVGLATVATLVAVGAATGAIGGFVGGKLNDREDGGDPGAHREPWEPDSGAGSERRRGGATDAEEDGGTGEPGQADTAGEPARADEAGEPRDPEGGHDAP